MSIQHHRLRRGYDIPVKGKPQEQWKTISSSSSFSVRPPEFHYVKPKLTVKIGDSVKIGSPLFFDKRRPDLKFASPSSGSIRDIHFGPRRVVERVVIDSSSTEEYEQQESFRPNEIRNLSEDHLKEHLLRGGIWPYIRQRPFDIIANPEQRPDSFFVNCMDTSPLACDPEFALQDKKVEFQAGIDAILRLSDEVHIVFSGEKKNSIFSDLKLHNPKGIFFHSFCGPHPSGLVGSHIHRVRPLSSKKTIWYLNARDLVSIGSFLLVGQYPSEKRIAVGGACLRETFYCKYKAGSSLKSLLSPILHESENRIISGNLLTGKKIELEDSLGFYDDLVSVIPKGGERRFLGWLGFGCNLPTWSRAYLSSFRASVLFSALLPADKRKLYPMDASLNGELRAFVKTGDYEKVVGMDIHPSFLAKAILAEDIEQMQDLGIYETSPEDLALCSYICPSKIDFQSIIRSGLDFALEETS